MALTAAAAGPRRFRALLALLMLLALGACQPPQPLVIGFVGSLSDRHSDTGQSGQNGVILALEQFNRDGGVQGRRVELLSRDDAQDRHQAAKAAQELVAAQVEAVIGPFTSGMAAVVVPITGAAGLFQISPTVTSMDFFGRDDNLFRINRTTRDNARDYARVMTGLGQRRIAVAYDLRNRSFSESWLQEFSEAVRQHGRDLVAEVGYESGPAVDFEAVIRRMLASKPDSLFFIAGALDVARLSQQARQLAPQLPLGASEWAASEQLVELGGAAVQGLLVVQNFDRDDTSARYKAFSEAYLKRFQRPPGYAAVSAYDATTVLLTALRQRRAGETVKQAVLRNGPYQGLQQQISFDANGDTERRVFFTEIRDGRYVKLK